MIETARLILRQWRPEDRGPFAALNADPVVMEHFPSTLTRAESDAYADRAEAGITANGYGLFAVEVKGGAPFIGYVGLTALNPAVPYAPAIEIGWRLARDAWGHGYASEAASAVLRHGFEVLDLDEIVSITATTNLRSAAVMQRIGLLADPSKDFEHPVLPEGHRLRRHVYYSLRNPAR